MSQVATDTKAPTRFVRADGIAKVTGDARYTADLSLPGMLHAAFVYAARPHARILSIDTTEASALPGVVAVLTARDVTQHHYGPSVRDRLLFADGIVRYEGEIVAGVAAQSRALAEQAAHLVRVEYEELEPVFDPEASLADGAPLVHPAWEATETAYEGLVRNGNDCGFVNIVKGDVEAGFAEADEVVEERYVADMAHAVPIEPHAVLADWQGPRVTIWSSTQVPFLARDGTARALGIEEGDVRVVVPYLGGGFGGKCDFHFEAHVAALARATRRPVRLVFSRREEFLVPDHARQPMVMDLRMGARHDGTITALQASVLVDTGAYASDSPILTEIATMMLAGPYKIPNLHIEGHTVYTNKTPGGSVRAPTGPEGCWAIESHLDEVAARIGFDPVELRRRNLLADGDLGPTGQQMEATGVKACLERAATMIGWDSRAGLPAGEGVGVACGWWFSSPASTGAYVKLNGDGSAAVVTGAQENGSGAVMGLALLVADELGIAPERVSFVYQDTDAGPWDAGSAGSQTTFNVGRAVLEASAELRDRLVERAADLLEAAPEDVVLEGGRAQVKGDPAKSFSVAELVAGAMEDGEQLIASSAPSAPPMPESFGSSACVGRAVFPAFAAPAFVCQAARVRVDPETGVTRVLQVAAAHDFGRVINPVGAEGQVEGGVAMGVGMALYEGTLYEGGHQRNPDLLDYKIATAADAPAVDVAFVDAPVGSGRGGPFGSKGVGEPPCVPTPGAVANAIAAATGVRVRRLPMTPYRILETVARGQSS